MPCKYTVALMVLTLISVQGNKKDYRAGIIRFESYLLSVLIQSQANQVDVGGDI